MKFIIIPLSLLGAFIAVSSNEFPFRRNKTVPHIIGGDEIDIFFRPFQVALYWRGIFKCSGTILSPKWILTAAHCIDDDVEPEYVDFRAGSSNHEEGGQLVTAKDYSLHPNYDWALLTNDVAVVELATPLTFGSNVAAITVADTDVPIGGTVEVSGWGLTEDNVYSEKLRIVQLQVIENADCSQRIGDTVTADMVCATAPDKDSCQRDSGGPMTYRTIGGTFVQSGIVSWGPLGKCGVLPGVYTRLSYPAIRNFIRSETGL